MAFSGMDVGEVEHIAAQLELEVNAINAVVSVIDRGVSALAGVWMGDDVSVFSGLWLQSHRPHAQSVADSLSTWVTQLREQARDQVHTSGGRGHQGGHHSGWLDSIFGPNGPFGDAAAAGLLGSLANVAPSIYSLLDKMAHWTGSGRYTDVWRAFMRDAGPFGDLLHFKRSPIMQFLDSHGWLAPLQENKNLIGAGGTMIGVAGSVAAVVQDGYSAYDDFRTGDYWGGAAHSLDVVADVASNSSDPRVKLGVFAVHVISYDIQAAQEVDWGYMPETMAYAWAHPGEVAESFGDALGEVGGKVLSWL